MDNLQTSLAEQLTSFDAKLGSSSDDVQLLTEIREAISRMLGADGGNEAQIRRVLHDRYESGQLRKETFQLVKSMLDGFASDAGSATGTGTVVMAPVEVAEPPMTQTVVLDSGDPMTSTQVLPADTTIVQPETAEERVQVGSLLRDRFLLQERVSAGGMGVVYKALDRRLAEGGGDNPWVAIKVLSPQFAQNGPALRALQQEAAKGRCLTHPNIVRFIDLDRDEDLYFIVMEWLQGRTLADILDSPDASGIDARRAFEIVQQVGKALDYAHRCGIVHADIKPGNIMLMPNGDAKLFDFGIARVRQQSLQHQPDFDPGVLGLMTPAYSSMQVLTGEEPTPADDVFSLACLLYRLLAGYRVFGPRNAAEAAEEGMKPQRLDNVNDAQWRVIKKALSYARVTRFESMGDFLAALDVREEEPITITVPARDDLDIPSQDHGNAKWVAAVVLVLGGLAVAAWQFGLVDSVRERVATEDVPVVEQAPPPETREPAVSDTEAPALAEPAAAATEPLVQEEPEPAPVEMPGPPVVENFGPPAEAIETNPVEPEAAAPEPAALVPAAPAEEEVVIAKPEELPPPLIDYSKLPPATAELRLVEGVGRATPVEVRLRENGAPATVDLIRDNTEFPLTLRVEEVGFSGNRSPWVAGQYSFSDNGFVEIPAGQDRARVTLTMTPDPVREADQSSTLRVRYADTSASELGVINVVLEDDDQRAFEMTLPPNTVGFATSQVSVREQDPAVQIDILRFNPDSTTMVVGYTIRDITATRGEDYFPPSAYTIEFGPGQRSARLLIPLVQDSVYENNEAFSVELATADSLAGTDVYFRTAVMIRDDDT